MPRRQLTKQNSTKQQRRAQQARDIARKRQQQRGLMDVLDRFSGSATVGIGYNSAGGSSSTKWGGGRRSAVTASDDGVTVFKRREMMPMKTINTIEPEVLISQHLNPGNPNLFPRLAHHATGFTEYQIRYLRFEFISTATKMVSGSTTFGVTTINNEGPIDAHSIAAYGAQISCALTKNCALETDQRYYSQRKWYQVSTKHESLPFDPIKDAGRFDLVAGTSSPPMSLGILYVTYEIAFRMPRLVRPSGSPEAPSKHLAMVLSSALGITTNNVAPLLGWSLTPVTDGTVYTISDIFGFDWSRSFFARGMKVGFDDVKMVGSGESTQLWLPPGFYLVTLVCTFYNDLAASAMQWRTTPNSWYGDIGHVGMTQGTLTFHLEDVADLSTCSSTIFIQIDDGDNPYIELLGTFGAADDLHRVDFNISAADPDQRGVDLLA